MRLSESVRLLETSQKYLQSKRNLRSMYLSGFPPIDFIKHFFLTTRGEKFNDSGRGSIFDEREEVRKNYSSLSELEGHLRKELL